MLILLFDVSCTVHVVKIPPLHIPDLHWYMGQDVVLMFCLLRWLHSCLALRQVDLSIYMMFKCRTSQRTVGKGTWLARGFGSSAFWAFQRPGCAPSFQPTVLARAVCCVPGLLTSSADNSVHWVPYSRTPCPRKEFWHRFLQPSRHTSTGFLWAPQRFFIGSLG